MNKTEDVIKPKRTSNIVNTIINRCHMKPDCTVSGECLSSKVSFIKLSEHSHVS